jgi:hypothetical protein
MLLLLCDELVRNEKNIRRAGEKGVRAGGVFLKNNLRFLRSPVYNTGIRGPTAVRMADRSELFGDETAVQITAVSLFIPVAQGNHSDNDQCELEHQSNHHNCHHEHHPLPEVERNRPAIGPLRPILFFLTLASCNRLFPIKRRGFRRKTF